MATVHFTEYDVRQLLEARKFSFRVKYDSTQNKNSDSEKRIDYDIRRRDMPAKDLGLRLCARVAPSAPGVGVKSTPGVALQWKGRIIRKVDHATRHDSIRNGVSVGHIEGWHEHIWTDQDEGRYIVAADPPIRNASLKGLIQWAAKKWNIELEEIAEEPLFRS
jgi:hypothetical protein